MQEETEIQISPQTLTAILGNQQEMTSLLKVDIEKNLTKIHDLLFNYHYDKRERVYDLSIENNSLVFDGSKGSFKVLYTIGFFNACADLDYHAPEKMKIDFTVAKDSNEILLKGEYWPERGQDEI